MTGAPQNLGVDTFPDPVGHFGAHWQAVRRCRQCGVAGGAALQAVRRCRRLASAPGAARLVLEYVVLDSPRNLSSISIAVLSNYEDNLDTAATTANKSMHFYPNAIYLFFPTIFRMSVSANIRFSAASPLLSFSSFCRIQIDIFSSVVSTD